MGKDEEKASKKTAKDEWKVQLITVDKEHLPKEYLMKGDKILGELGALAKILNELEKINEALLS